MGFSSGSSKLPKMNFPVFDGDNAKLWISHSEMYFDLFALDSSMWIKVASMNFSAAAARWLQSMDEKAKGASWVQFCKMILKRFGKGKIGCVAMKDHDFRKIPPKDANVT